MGAEQRTLKNYFKSAMQIKGFYFQIAASGVILVAILMTYAVKVLNQIGDILLTSNLENVGDINNKLFTVVLMFICSFAVFILCTLACMLVVGQRVGGASVAICNFIRHLKKGNYESQRTLRDGDELGNIMMELVDLAQVLKERENK